MMRYMKLASVATLSLFVGTSAISDVTLSQANDPAAAVSSQLTSLLGAERNGIEALSPRRIQKLVALPKVKKSKSKITYTRDWVDSQPEVTGDKQWACLSEALYFEARGESVKGQFAVAEVILNRVKSGSYPDTICGVVNQGTGKKYQCQFTYTCDGIPEKFNEPRAHARVGKIAKLSIDGKADVLTDGATHYHTKAVNPRWSRVFPRTTTIGVHHFYRQPTRMTQR